MQHKHKLNQQLCLPCGHAHALATVISWRDEHKKKQSQLIVFLLHPNARLNFPGNNFRDI